MNNPKHYLLLILCLMQLISGAQQHPFSNEVVIDAYGNETMPYTRGETKRFIYNSSQVSGDQQSELVNEMEKVCSITSGWSKLSPPQGYNVEYKKIISVAFNNNIFESAEEDPAAFLCYSLDIAFRPFYKGENGTPVTSSEIASGIDLDFNNPYCMVGSPLIADIYVCPRQIAEFYGYPIYRTNISEITIVSKKQMPLFIPVTQEEYIHAHIKHWEDELAKNQKEQRKPENQKSYRETFEEEKKERLANMEEAYNELLKVDRKMAEDFKKTSLENEAKLSAELLVSQEAGIPDSEKFKESSNTISDCIEELKKELSALSPSQRKLQAHYDVDAMEIYHNHSGLVPFEKAKPRVNCEPLIRVNPKIVDHRNSSPQLLVLSWSILFAGTKSCESPRFFDNDPKNYMAHAGDIGIAQLYKQQEIWEKIFQLVE